MPEPRQEFQIRITKPAEKQLKNLAKKLGRQVFRQVSVAILELKHDPEARTQRLAGKLSAYRSLHVNRCRIVVKISEVAVTVHVVAAGWHTSGHRDDIYEEFRRMLERRGDAIKRESGGPDDESAKS